MRCRLYLLFLLLVVAACQPAPASETLPPTVIPFPTMTPGRLLRGALPTSAAQAGANALLANPATAVALANRPTITPDYGRCPVIGSPELPEKPTGGRALADAITRFLSDGGASAALESGLRNDWQVMDENAVLRADLDLTGEGAPEILLTLNALDDGGTLLILGCGDGRYVRRYAASTGGETPQIIQIGDMNFDGKPDVLYASRVCEDDECVERSQLITWRGDLGRFVSLLERDVTGDDLPTVSDVDNDQVVEVVVRLDNPGNADTGPLRTGVQIYDWNGATYVQSIVQLDPPRFRIQVIHDADKAFARLNMDEAIPLYEFALTTPTLEAWQSGEEQILQSYVLYRLLMARAYVEDDDLLQAYQTILDTFPDPTSAPVYVELSTTFWNALQVTNNLRSACIEVKEIITLRPEAVGLLNRYGERSPEYTADTVCPF